MAKDTDQTVKDSVLVIMPFGGWFDTYYSEIYKPAIDKAKLISQRVDDSNLPVAIVQQMFEMTQEAKIVLSDLTGNNANVCYELGLAHALDKPVVIITDSTESLPFDVSAFRVVLYDKNVPDWGKELKQKLISALEEITKDPKKSVPSRLLRAKEEAPTAELVNVHDGLQLDELELQKRQYLHRHFPDAPMYRIGPSEARALIEHYKKNQMPKEVIISRLSRYGVPRFWVSKYVK